MRKAKALFSPACKMPRAPDEDLGLLGGVPLLEERRMTGEKEGEYFIFDIGVML